MRIVSSDCAVFDRRQERMQLGTLLDTEGYISCTQLKPGNRNPDEVDPENEDIMQEDTGSEDDDITEMEEEDDDDE